MTSIFIMVLACKYHMIVSMRRWGINYWMVALAIRRGWTACARCLRRYVLLRFILHVHSLLVNSFMQHAITQYIFIASMMLVWIPMVGMCFGHFRLLYSISFAGYGGLMETLALSYRFCPDTCLGVHVGGWNTINCVMGFLVLYVHMRGSASWCVD